LLTKLILLAVLTLGQEAPDSASSPPAGTSPSEQSGQLKLPQQVQDMEGTFKGKWTSYKYEGGRAVKKSSWTDTLVCDNLRKVAGKTVVDFNATSIFEENSITRTRSWKEGYFLTDTGEVDERYVEYFDTLIRLKKISDTTWVYSIPMATPEFDQMGFNSAIRGEHIVIMVDQKESGVDTRRLTRITSVVHKDDDGNETTTQFVSLRGFHRRAS